MDTALKITPERFSGGLTIEQFIGNMKKNRETFESNYNGFALRPEDERFLRGLDKPLKVVILAEDWCGDVVRYMPVFARMAEVTPNWTARVFYRDENLDLADRCLKDGKYRAIPVFLFFDQDMNELACFTERPAAVYAAEDAANEEFARQHPELPDASRPAGEMGEAAYNEYVPYIRAFRAENQPRWHQIFVEDIIGRLKAAGLGEL